VKYHHELQGYNSRLDEVQAACLRVKLSVLEDWNARRRAIAAAYTQKLAACPIILPMVPQWAHPVWHLYVIRTTQRDALQTYLTKHGVGTVIHYPTPPHLQPCYANTTASQPVAELLAREVISLPLTPLMEPEEIDYVVATIAAFYLETT
jgi:dTDP-4-amino-4,6-dideoxygalactose transaminase